MSRQKQKAREYAGPSHDSVRRQMEKGNAKEALKEAKLCYRADPSSDHQILLEQAFLFRIDQLYRFNQLDDARAVLIDLTAIKNVATETKTGIQRMQMLLNNQPSAAALSDNPELLTEVADRAVLDPSKHVPNQNDLPKQVQVVRDALRLVEQGDDQKAADCLNEIPRSSPLSDWRLFVRGLSAFYQYDHERTLANWSRLDANRPAHRIASTLMRAIKSKLPGPASSGQSNADEIADVKARDADRRLEIYQKNRSGNGILNEIVEFVQRSDLRAVYASMKRLHDSESPEHRQLYEKLLDILWRDTSQAESSSAVLLLTRSLSPPLLDPNWNRLNAIFADDNLPIDDGPDESERCWRQYIDELEEMPFLASEQKEIVTAVILENIADSLTDIITHLADKIEEDAADARFLSYHDSVIDHIKSLHNRYEKNREEILLECTRLSVKLPDPYICLIDIYETQATKISLKKAEFLAAELLSSHPDNLFASCWLIRHYCQIGKPEKARSVLTDALTLRPRDTTLNELSIYLSSQLICQHVQERKFTLAIEEIERFAASQQVAGNTVLSQVYSIGVKLLTDPETASEEIAELVDQSKEPCVVWLNLCRLVTDFKLPKNWRTEFDKPVRDALSKELTAERAGEIARFFLGLHGNGHNYVGRAEHEKLFVKAIKPLSNSHRKIWTIEDLRDVCEFFLDRKDQKIIRRTLLERGAKLFPADPHLLFWYCRELMRLDSWRSNKLQLIQMLRAAISSHENGPRQLSPDDLKELKELQKEAETRSTLFERFFQALDNREINELFGDPDDDDDDGDDDDDDF